ncbi:Het domain protein [Lasiodiplodia theobromae]|uniref:Het domain protein n=1 Tax=Lasiodiplodia theobromae TaxID=45133 RepID=UPI0015C3DA79|nr:Het domain protein [Lasiodiplodia theobromae]KAF4539475.1 Het domain protein [Lasiodiplodia theobromae]
MDHLLTPKHPARPTPRVRYFCQQEYDRGDFLTYPERMGWVDEGDTWLDLSAWCDADEATAFLQQWLFFGLLHEFFGDSADFSAFIETDENSGIRYVHTRELLPLARAFMETEKVDEVLSLRKFNFRACLKKTFSVYHAVTDEQEEFLDPYFQLSLVATARFLTHVAKLLYPDEFEIWNWTLPCISLDEDRLANAKIQDLDADMDILGVEMIQSGWCPRQVEKGTYHTKHVQPGCGCAWRSLDTGALGDILRAGNIPIVTLGDDEKLHLSSAEIDSNDPTYYVAISHVWSDGLGNPQDNAMPLCQLRRIQTLVQGLSTLQNPADLQEVEASDLPLTDQVYLAGLSFWASRLWTLQEGALGSHVDMLFKDTVFPLDSAWNANLANEDEWGLARVNPVDFDYMLRLIRGDKTAQASNNDPTRFSLRFAVIALSRRTTSYREDEALCLGSLLEADMQEITQAERKDRLKALWRTLPSIPREVLFLREATMEEPGYRWAPSTLLGIPDAGDRVILSSEALSTLSNARYFKFFGFGTGIVENCTRWSGKHRF